MHAPKYFNKQTIIPLDLFSFLAVQLQTGEPIGYHKKKKNSMVQIFSENGSAPIKIHRELI